MRSCPSAATFEQFLSDVLPARRVKEVENHLHHCTKCQELVDRLSDDELLQQEFERYRARVTLGASAESWRGHRERWYAIVDESEAPVASLAGDELARGQLAGGPDIPAELGRFRIERELGRGGFGIVYLAYDPKLHRKVALKMPHPEATYSPKLRARFLREARAAAALNHPYIASIFETGEIGDVCYLVSAYYPGGTLAEYLDGCQQPLDAREAAQLVAMLAEALHYAHQCGVLHRDVKPSNVLLEPISAADAAQTGRFAFAARLTDFGLARFLEADPETEANTTESMLRGVTQTGMLVGTPRYMAPEQIDAEPSAIGRPTDVYGLGTVLYELLTGHTPFESSRRQELLRNILFADVVPPHRLRPGLPRDLEAICLKCLEKSADRRYQTAGELRDDLQRFLTGAPTLARPLTATQRMARWAQQRPAVTALIGAAVLAVVGLICGLTMHNMRLQAYAKALQASLGREAQRADEVRVQKELAQQRELVARHEAYASQTAHAWRLWREGKGPFICEILNRQRPPPDEEDLRDFSWYYLWALGRNVTDLRTGQGTTQGVCFSPDGRWFAARHHSAINLWDVENRRLLHTLPCDSRPEAVTFSTDGQLLTSAHEGVMYVWDVQSGRRIATRPGPPLEAGAFSPDGQRLAYVAPRGANVLQMWDVEQAAAVASFPTDIHPSGGQGTCFSPDSRQLALGRIADDATGRIAIQVLDATSGQVLQELCSDCQWVDNLSYSLDGQWLIAGTHGGEHRLFDLTSGKETVSARAEPGSIVQAAISPHGDIVATQFGKLEGLQEPAPYYEVRLDDRHSGDPVGRLPTAGEWIYALRFSPDGTLAFGGSNGFFRLWNHKQQAAFERWDAQHLETWSVAFSPDSRWLASSGDDHDVRLWDVATRAELRTLSGHESLVTACRFLPDGRSLVTACYDGTLKLWDARTGKELHGWRGHEGPVRSISLGRQGTLLLTCGDDRLARLWRLPDGELLHTFVEHQDRVRTTAFHPNNRWLLSADNNGLILLRDVDTGIVRRHWHDTIQVQSLAVSSDGKLLAASTKEGQIHLYSLEDDTKLATLIGHEAPIRTIVISPDGKTLASGGEDKMIKLWHLATGHELLTLTGTTAQINELAFSPDGAVLAAATHDGRVTLWRAPREN